MSIADAVAELERNAGAQFDPEIVRAFLGAMERGEIEALVAGSASPEHAGA
jgi:HD-GYP domain-containing protein (c-di-GMP phosphodiesterase class II)